MTSEKFLKPELIMQEEKARKKLKLNEENSREKSALCQEKRFNLNCLSLVALNTFPKASSF